MMKHNGNSDGRVSKFLECLPFLELKQMLLNMQIDSCEYTLHLFPFIFIYIIMINFLLDRFSEHLFSFIMD